VVVYVPDSASEGIVTLTNITRLNTPKPERKAALKNFTGDGGVVPAGMVSG
jgi:hypothetical protein